MISILLLSLSMTASTLGLIRVKSIRNRPGIDLIAHATPRFQMLVHTRMRQAVTLLHRVGLDFSPCTSFFVALFPSPERYIIASGVRDSLEIYLCRRMRLLKRAILDIPVNTMFIVADLKIGQACKFVTIYVFLIIYLQRDTYICIRER